MFKKANFSFLLILLLFSSFLGAKTCKSFNEELNGISGTMKLQGDICLNNDNYSEEAGGSVLVSFDHYDSGKGFVRDGSMMLNYSTNSIKPSPGELSIRYSGGPVIYTLEGVDYVVDYQDATYIFDGGMVKKSVLGQILVNGQALSEIKDLYPYLDVF